MNSRIILLVLFMINMSYGQSYYDKFKEVSKEMDTIQQLKLLKEWELKNQNDPELYTCYFNYYFSRSKSNLLSIDKESNGSEGFQLKDSTGNIAGYIQSNKTFDLKYSTKGIEYIDAGIVKFPKRLDMRFGKIYVLGALENYTEFTNEIIKTIEYSHTIKNDWLWTEDKKLDDAQDFMLSSIQSYINQLYDTGNDELLENMKTISETVLKYYPNQVESLSNVSVVYLLKKKYDKGLEYLLKAEKIRPDDVIVLGNIAQAYKLKGDHKNAIKYYELVEKYGDDDAKTFSKEEIEKLKQK